MLLPWQKICQNAFCAIVSAWVNEFCKCKEKQFDCPKLMAPMFSAQLGRKSQQCTLSDISK